MRIGYLECFAGISGDMLLGALVDAGVPAQVMSDAVASLGLGAVLAFDAVDRSGIRSLKARVLVNGRDADAPVDQGSGTRDQGLGVAEQGAGSREQSHTHEHVHSHAHTHDGEQMHEHSYMHAHSHSHAHAHTHEDEHGHTHPHTHAGADHSHTNGHAHGRTLPVIRGILVRGSMTAAARRMALAAFESLGRAEAKIHGAALDEVHFHEVGAVDAIVDIVCAAVGLDFLQAECWYCTPINVGGGSVECAHGRFPVPAPATAELLKGMPTYSAGVQAELVTPTGAALLRALGPTFQPAAALTIHSIGYGAGTRNPPKFPNVLRLSVGEESLVSTFAQPASQNETVTVLECAVDDLSPQVVAYAAQQALSAGALDVMCSSAVMKKGRMGTLITVLCRPEDASELQGLLFRETSTLGIRIRSEERAVLARSFSEVETRYGTVRIKIGRMKTGSSNPQEVNAAPEYEDCRERAAEHGVPVKLVMQAAMAAWHGAQQPREQDALQHD